VVLASYNADSGQLQWQMTDPSTFDTFALSGIQLANHLVYLAIRESDPEGLGQARSFIAAYRLTDGARVWASPPPPPPTDEPLDTFAMSFAVSGGDLFQASRHICLSTLQRLNAADGSIIWTNTTSLSTGECAQFNTLNLVHDRIVVSGSANLITSLDVLKPTWWVFDKAGSLLLEEKDIPQTGLAVVAAAVQGNRVAAVGSVAGISGGAVVRLYELKP